MKRWILIAALAAAPVQAQDEGQSLMERGMQLFLEGLMTEAEPMVNELQGLLEEMEPAMRSFVERMGPALSDLMGEIEDWSAYHPPEILPNGDIIIRRKQDAQEALPEGEIEL